MEEPQYSLDGFTTFIYIQNPIIVVVDIFRVDNSIAIGVDWQDIIAVV